MQESKESKKLISNTKKFILDKSKEILDESKEKHEIKATQINNNILFIYLKNKTSSQEAKDELTKNISEEIIRGLVPHVKKEISNLPILQISEVGDEAIKIEF